MPISFVLRDQFKKLFSSNTTDFTFIYMDVSYTQILVRRHLRYRLISAGNLQVCAVTTVPIIWPRTPLGWSATNATWLTACGLSPEPSPPCWTVRTCTCSQMSLPLVTGHVSVVMLIMQRKSGRRELFTSYSNFWISQLDSVKLLAVLLNIALSFVLCVFNNLLPRRQIEV